MNRALWIVTGALAAALLTGEGKAIAQEIFGREAATQQRLDRVVVVRAPRNRTLEDGRIRRETRHRQLVDVLTERSARQERSRNVVEPDALADFMQFFQRTQAAFLSEPRAMRSVVPVAAS